MRTWRKLANSVYRMGTQPTRILIMGAALEELHDFQGDIRKDVPRECHSPQRLDARSRGVGFEPIEQGGCLLGGYNEERIQGSTDRHGQAGGHPVIDILQEAPESGLDQPLPRLRRGEFQAQSAQAGIRAGAQGVFGRSVQSPLGPEPYCQRLLILAGGQAAAQVLPDHGHVHIPRAGMARIGGRMVPQQVELVRDKGADDFRDAGKGVGEIAQIRDRLQQHGYPMAIDIAATGLHQRTFRWRQQKMLGEFLIAIGHLENRIITLHAHRAVMGEASSQQGKNR
jgi:hypothetical protein